MLHFKEYEIKVKWEMETKGVVISWRGFSVIVNIVGSSNLKHMNPFWDHMR